MQATGIIAEYNPFHNGHKYQLDSVRRETKADYIVIAMSGDFLQRGVPAVIDKYTRTRMALECGADLVLELPVRWATASAEYFASAGVSLLGKTGVIQTLCYGCEEVSPSLVHALVSLMVERPDAFSQTLSQYMKKGDSYPLARSKALCHLLPELDPSKVSSFLASPNNILALEYEKAIMRWNHIHSRKIDGHAIRRTGPGYHSLCLDGSYASATAIRSLLWKATSSDLQVRQTQSASDLPIWFTRLQKAVPENVSHTLLQAAQNRLLLDSDDFSAALYTGLWSQKDGGYAHFADCSEELSNRIIRNLDQYLSFTQFATLLKSRDITYTRVCRALMHILLNIRQGDYNSLWSDRGIPCLRVLGFRKDASPLLTAIKKEASVPLITKVADASHTLDPDAQSLLAQDIHCADLYRGTAAMHSGMQLPNEYTQGIVLV